MSKRLLDLTKESDREIAVQWLEEPDEEFLEDNLSDTSEVEDLLEIESDTESTEEDEFGTDENIDQSNYLKNTQFISKDGTTWCKTPPKVTRRKCQDIVTVKPGLNGKSRNVENIIDCFKLFIDDEIIDIVVKFTNQKGALFYEQYNNKNPLKQKIWISTNRVEMYAVFGILITMGALKAKRGPISFLWNKDAVYCRPIFCAAMSRDRIKELLLFMRYDDTTTRDIRRSTDKLAAIRQVFDIFVKNCNDSYNPSLHLTVDEQLVGFRGKCPFRIYMKSKPAKYGIKIWALVDVETTYAKNLQVYLGKTNDKPEKEQGKRVVLDLVSCLDRGYGITTDNFFTSKSLANELAGRGLTLCGTLRQNKREIPPVLKNKDRPEKSSIFCFDKNITLVSYVPKKGKSVILLSTEHHDDKVGNEDNNFKPDIIEHYNKTKGSVDTMDKMINEYSVKRSTKRWPFVIFQNILDIASMNAYVVWTTKHPELKKKCDFRRNVLLELGRDLIKPNATERLRNKNLHKRVVDAIQLLVPTALTDKPIVGPSTSSKRCALCPRKNDKRTRRLCQKCNKPICPNHSVATKTIICTFCQDVSI